MQRKDLRKLARPRLPFWQTARSFTQQVSHWLDAICYTIYAAFDLAMTFGDVLTVNPYDQFDPTDANAIEIRFADLTFHDFVTFKKGMKFGGGLPESLVLA
jgi:hypothetical protein